jgi:hypothetical protein
MGATWSGLTQLPSRMLIDVGLIKLPKGDKALSYEEAVQRYMKDTKASTKTAQNDLESGGSGRRFYE